MNFVAILYYKNYVSVDVFSKTIDDYSEIKLKWMEMHNY